MTDHQHTAAGARPRIERLGRGVELRSVAQQAADDEHFSQGLAALRAYAHAQGDTRVPDGHLDADGFPLAAWVAGQRIAHLEGELSAHRRAALEGIPGWQWEPVRDRWHRTGEGGI